MEVIPLMERLVYFLAKRQEILFPSYACAEVGIVGIELEPDTTGQAIEHRIHHLVYLDEEAAVNTDMVHHSPMKGFINPLI